jgi:hypothetical protein
VDPGDQLREVIAMFDMTSFGMAGAEKSMGGMVKGLQTHKLCVSVIWKANDNLSYMCY